jgi:oligopeptide/dipeptide ABC transporter ATP-binding protein
MSTPIVDVRGLTVDFGSRKHKVRAVAGVDLTLAKGETLALLGESGSGKSVTLRALVRLHPKSARIGGSITVDGRDVLAMPAGELSRYRGGTVSMVFQDPGLAFDPVYRVGDQIAEQILAHEPDTTRKQARGRAAELLQRVGIPHAHERARSFPHEFSGGMRQRVMIAMALSCSPELLIADEPTTALDVTIQAQILRELRALREDTGAGIVIVTHDLGVVADVADRVIVMYAGRVVEQGTVDELFYDPQHPYTWGLLGSIARVDQPKGTRLQAIPGQPPSLLHPPEGCHFRPRCPFAFERCFEVPPLDSRVRVPGHRDRCWLSVAEKRRLAA